MLEFQKKKRIRKIISSPFLLIFLIILFFILIRSVWNVYNKEQLSLENLKKEQIEMEKLAVRQKNLASSIDYLKTDQGVESEIRNKFRAVKDGERVAVIVDEQSSSTQKTMNASTTKQHGFWYNVFH